MSSRSKQKGTAWETAVVEWLKGHDIRTAARSALHGANDIGDIIGVENWTLECKNEGIYTPAQWVTELAREVSNNETDFGAVIAHRKGKVSPDDAYVLMSGRLFIPVLYATRG